MALQEGTARTPSETAQELTQVQRCGLTADVPVRVHVWKCPVCRNGGLSDAVLASVVAIT